jgi:hypothetical protein
VGASSGESWRCAPGQDAAQRDAVALDEHRPFHALFAPVDRGWAGDLAATRSLGDASVDGDLVEDQSDDAVVGLAGDAGQRANTPSSIHSSRRVRRVVAEQVLSAIAS